MPKSIRAVCVPLLPLVLSGCAFVQTAKTAEVLLVETGEDFHGDEVKASNGEKWLGLYVTKDSSLLAESTLTVRRVFDPVIDEDERKPTGKSVSVGRREKPVFLVKNAVMLRQGEATTVYQVEHDEALSFGRKALVTLKLSGRTYQLKVVSQKRRLPVADGLLPSDAKLLFTSGSSTQTLHSLKNNDDDACWYLLWAGDVDGDGKLDLYLSLDGYNFEQRVLFLSSQAKAGNLVSKVAEFVMTGC